MVLFSNMCGKKVAILRLLCKIDTLDGIYRGMGWLRLVGSLKL